MFKIIVNHYAISRKNEKMTVVFWRYVILNYPGRRLSAPGLLPANAFLTAFTQYL